MRSIESWTKFRFVASVNLVEFAGLEVFKFLNRNNIKYKKRL